MDTAWQHDFADDQGKASVAMNCGVTIYGFALPLDTLSVYHPLPIVGQGSGMEHPSSPGEVTEWPIVLVSKTSVGASPPRVRIPPSPFIRHQSPEQIATQSVRAIPLFGTSELCRTCVKSTARLVRMFRGCFGLE